jgi:hypothetical protein
MVPQRAGWGTAGLWNARSGSPNVPGPDSPGRSEPPHTEACQSSRACGCHCVRPRLVNRMTQLLETTTVWHPIGV